MSTAVTAPAGSAVQLRARAVSCLLLARVLGPDPESLVDPETLGALRESLALAEAEAARSRLSAIETEPADRAGELAGRWVRWFDLGRVAPYEGSNVAATAGGVTPRLADIAGFYRAFGLEVVGERPDHVVAQLEFLAMGLMAEAEAVEVDDVESAEAAASAVRAFLRDHVGGWIEAWAARVGAVEETAPWFPYAAAAAEVVRLEAARHNVVPVSDSAILPADAGLADDRLAVLACEDDLDD